MALLPKKTYSRRNNDLTVFSVSDKEKENIDPFDELLSSPLKQEVEFQPLSFWGKKLRRLDSKEKSEGLDFGLFKSSDSDEPNSPCQRKRKPKTKILKARMLQPESRRQKLSNKRKSNSTAYSCISRLKSKKSLISNGTVMSTLQTGKNKGWSLDNTSYSNDTMEEKLKSSCENSDLSKFKNFNKHFKEANSINHSFCIRSKTSLSSEPQNETNFTEADNLTFKIFEDIKVSQEQSVETDNDTLVYNNEEDTTNSTINFENSLHKTLFPFQSGDDSFKFISVRRHFNYPYSIIVHDRNFSDSAEFTESLVETWSESKDSASPINWKSKDVCMSEEFDNESMNESLCKENSAPDLREKCMLMNDSEETVFNLTTAPEFEDNSLIYLENSSINASLNYDYSVDKNLCNEDSTTFFAEESKESSVLGCLSENTPFDHDVLLCFNDTHLEEISQELINVDGVVLETSSTSDDTLSSFMDEETVINVRLKAEKSDSQTTGSDKEKNISHSVSNGVSVLTTSMSELSIKNISGAVSPELEKETGSQDSAYDDNEKKSFAMDSRNVTTKRRGIQNKRFQKNCLDRLSRITSQEFQNEDAEMECDQSLWIAGRASMDWNKSISFVNPVFESTRVLDVDLTDRKRLTKHFEDNDSVLEDTLSAFGRTCVLKPGKKWLRSLSVLKQLQNGTIVGERLESTRITGRKFDSFMKEMLEIQNERSGFLTSLVNNTVSNKTFNDGNLKNTHFRDVNAIKSVVESEDLLENFNCSLSSNETLQKTSLNHTVKVIEPEEQPNDFRSALGLEDSKSLPSACSSVSAKDFILIQCGQKDVLPFEDYFNERTLKNCKKIGEGVYGEVFMYSDTVVKIIPIEGADTVNGEHQKTFAEIIPEVVIASKLSNLRKGTAHRTEGFNEMKRCWCVKGKYPKYLLELWNKYDEQRGSENDSPAMFKDDQLYIILELANGGKDLEAFVFTSSAQSLSILIQLLTFGSVKELWVYLMYSSIMTRSTLFNESKNNFRSYIRKFSNNSTAFSLAVAEKAFEFEHRDLHWGNLLISETKSKFMTIYLDNVEYKIPTKGVKVCIIDFTLSRINHEGCCLFNDLSVDPGLFTSEGDYQFEIYRLMLREVQNDWSLFKPKTNTFWLHYTLDKMLKMVRYRNKKAKVHIKHLKDLKALEGMILECNDSTDFVLSSPLNDVINKL